MDLFQEILGLGRGGDEGFEVVVGTAQKAVFAGLIEVVVEVVVEEILAFRGLDDNEANAFVANLGRGEFRPVNLPLVVADVDATDGVAFGVSLLAIQSLPARGVGGHAVDVDQVADKANGGNPRQANGQHVGLLGKARQDSPCFGRGAAAAGRAAALAGTAGGRGGGFQGKAVHGRVGNATYCAIQMAV